MLDEADRMLDMGFVHDIKRVLALLPARRQNLLFSATFAQQVKNLADRLLNRPRLIEVERRNSTAEGVDQLVYRVDRSRKPELLAELIHCGGWSQVLVFTRTKHGVNRLAQKLDRTGITADAIHGNKSQGARTRALAGFKSGKVRVLVATEIAARGLDIDGLPHAVNFELPNVASDYIHRVGRTGRAGAAGQAVPLVCVDEHGLLRDIEKLLGRRLAAYEFEGFEPDPEIRPEPITRGGGQRSNRTNTASATRGSPSRKSRRRRNEGERNRARA